MAYLHRFFATVPKPLEPLLEEELRGLGARNIQKTVAGCYFDGTQADGYRVTIWSRLAGHVLLPLEHFDAETHEALYAGMQSVRWSEHFGVDQTFKITCNASKSALTHNRYAAQVAKDAVVDQFRDQFHRRPSVDRKHPDIHLNIHILRDRATVSLDLAGGSLHRRGYRVQQVDAPLKENVAAAVLQRAGWPTMFPRATPQSPLSIVDPMCGSGTLLIEAALMAADTPPSWLRQRFGCEGWRYHDQTAWTALQKEARERRESGRAHLRTHPILFQGNDIDPHATHAARTDIERAGLSDLITLRTQDFRTLNKPAPATDKGLIVTNAPYGERLEQDGRAVILHKALGETLTHQFSGWQASVLTGSKELGFALGLRAKRFYRLYNGPISCMLFNFDLTAPEQLSKPKT